MKDEIYIIKAGHCLTMLDNENDAIMYANKVGGAVVHSSDRLCYGV